MTGVILFTGFNSVGGFASDTRTTLWPFFTKPNRNRMFSRTSLERGI
jgi:hypothetical protein